MADSVRGVSALQTEIEKAKESLKDVDENIKKLTGRDPTIQRSVQRRVSLGSSEPSGRGVPATRTPGGENRLFSLARRGIIQDGGPSTPNTPRRGAFARLGPRPGGRARGPQGRDSGDEDDLPHRPSIQSSVVATPKEERSRQSSIDEQSKDRKGQARNRRMFGLLLGTLQKFKDESAVTKEKEEQRVQIEKKLEEKFKQEKEEILQERRQLYNERRRKQLTIKLLEQKMEMVKNHDNWEVETRKLEFFIRTKAKPHLFYMPKSLTPEMEKKLHDTKKVVDDIVEQRQKKLEEEISAMMAQVDGGVKEEDGEASMGEEEGDSAGEHSADESKHPERTSSAAGKHGDDKENESRERQASGEKDEVMEERERRDREREQRDKDRQERESKKRERDGGERDGKETAVDGVRRDRSGGREGQRDHADRGRGERHREHRRDKSGDAVSRGRDRDHHRSGKGRSEKRGRDSGDERSHGHGSKAKRRSKDGKADKREKVWAPMEDEEEEEFVGSKGENKGLGGGSDIASKMLAMAGMAGLNQEVGLEGGSDMGGREAAGTNSVERQCHAEEDNTMDDGFTKHGNGDPSPVEEH